MDIILGIETSCDETAAAVVSDGFRVHSNIVSSQIAKHAEYGGVIPELAAREHLTAINHVMDEALKSAGMSLNDINAVTVTNGPGLMPALLVGLNFARGLAYSNSIPLYGVDHFIAHMYGAFLNDNHHYLSDPETFPIVALVVSGGHTAIVLIDKNKKAEIIGTTIDDAAGEALDKGAKILNLGYPGGPIIDKLSRFGDIHKHRFPRSLTGGAGKPLAEHNKFNFSFSGLKTALLYHIEKQGDVLKEQEINDVVASYQYAIIDVLCMKALSVLKFYKAKSFVLCGGVAQNSFLREELKSRLPQNINFILTPREFCGDNAAMIAGLGWHYHKKQKPGDCLVDAYSTLPSFTEVPFVPDTF